MVVRSFVLALIVASIGACTSRRDEVNQAQRERSPHGYSLRVLRERGTVETYRATPVWKVAISDAKGRLMYKDDSSTLVGTLAVYWGWDERNQAWLYSSDDGAVWRWQLRDGTWTKVRSQRSQIPKSILPSYAR